MRRGTVVGRQAGDRGRIGVDGHERVVEGVVVLEVVEAFLAYRPDLY